MSSPLILQDFMTQINQVAVTVIDQISDLVLCLAISPDSRPSALVEKDMKLSNGLVIKIIYIPICYFSSLILGSD